jgi:hypothetical protein
MADRERLFSKMSMINGVLISTVDLRGIDLGGMFYETMVFAEHADNHITEVWRKWRPNKAFR